MSILDELRELNKAFVESEVQGTNSEFEEIPDGKYKCIIDKVDLKPSKSGKLMFLWDLKILDGKYKGQHLWKYQMMTEKGMEFFKGDLYKVGLPLENVTDIEDRREELLDIKLWVTQKSKAGSDFVNYFFGDLITDESETTKAKQEDDVPF